jgi:FixJ family two-component response regulator
MNAFALRKESESAVTRSATPVVAVVEPEVGTRWALLDLLRAHGFHGISCDDAASLLFLMRDTTLDAIVLEPRLPGMDGLALFQRLSTDPEAPAVVFLAERANVSEAVRCLRLGAVDFVEKSEDSTRVLSAIRRAVMRSNSQRHQRSLAEDAERTLSVLSPRERETFNCLVLGHTTEEVADDLGIALQTAKVHRSRVMQKLGVRSIADLVRIDAARRGLDWSQRSAVPSSLDATGPDDPMPNVEEPVPGANTTPGFLAIPASVS